MTDTPENPPFVRRVEPEDSGLRLDVFLTRQPEVYNRSVAKAMVQAGLVEVGARNCKVGMTLKAGETVSFRLPEEPVRQPLPESDWPPLKVLYEDAFILVIDKAAGIPAHPAENPRGPAGPDIAHMAVRHCGGPLPTVSGPDRPGVVHRLDKETSGVMLLAKTEEAFHFIRSQFKARTMRKEYRALCFGEPRFDSDYIERSIAPHPRYDRMRVVTEGGKEASTFYEIVERFHGVAFIRCLPKTGRTHQIRVHMTSVGHPLVADKVYRRRRASDCLPAGAPDPGRHCLHAWSLAFRHPRTHQEMMCEAPLPDDMEELLLWLRRHARLSPG